MLFTFPIDALGCNWLNPKVIETLLDGIDAIDSGAARQAWPGCLPADRRNVLRRRKGLRRKVVEFWETYEDLTDDEKKLVRSAIERQTSLPGVFADAAPCPSADALPDQVKERARRLAKYLFGQLSAIREGEQYLRDIQFEVIHESGIRICPFCGLNYFRPPGSSRNALDHLLPISKYPFAGADLRNLPPACHECNSTYKRDADIIFDEARQRRMCSDPYSGPTFQVTLDGSEFDLGNESGGARLPRWEISIVGESEQQAATWDTVYQIKSRYAAVLDADFVSWVKHFALWFVREVGRGRTADEVVSELPRYINNVVQDGFEDRAFLRAEAFEMLNKFCQDPTVGDDAKEWLWAFVEYSV